MDDETKAAFGEVGQRLDKVDGRLDRVEAKVGSVETRVEQVHSMIQEGAEERRRFHGEQMRSFQAVVEEIRADRDRRLAGVEAAIVELRA